MPKKKANIALNSQSREFVIRLRDYFERENQNNGPLLPLSQVVNRVADALSLGRTTICRITKGSESTSSSDKKEPEDLFPPLKKRKRKSPVTDIDDFDAATIRNHIFYVYYSRGKYPTLRKLSVSLKEADLFKCSVSSLAKVLKKIGFVYKKNDKKKILMESTDVALARINFLRKMKDVSDWDRVVFVDEMSIDANHTVSSLSTTKSSEGKAEKVIIAHAGKSTGFMPNCLLAFKAKKIGDQYQDMDSEMFTKWFSTLLKSLTESHIIVMDNAPYHSEQRNDAPTTVHSKSDVVLWLRSKGVEASESMLRNELLGLVALNKPTTPTYIVDEMAKDLGHTVVRLPAYHCHYNTFKLIWAEVKSHIAKHNTPLFTADKMLQLLNDAVQQVSMQDWQRVISKTKEIILEDWDNEVNLDKLADKKPVPVINLEDCSSESECENDSDEYD